jgi:hypothetical protein
MGRAAGSLTDRGKYHRLKMAQRHPRRRLAKRRRRTKYKTAPSYSRNIEEMGCKLFVQAVVQNFCAALT